MEFRTALPQRRKAGVHVSNRSRIFAGMTTDVVRLRALGNSVVSWYFAEL
jgi:hypothetical protein